MLICKKHFSLFAALLFFGLLTSCGGNFFKDVSSKTSDLARYEDALKAIDASDYQGAIDLIEATTPEFRTQTKVVQTWAGAYAGLCGLDFISVISGLGSSSGAPLLFFMQAFSNIAVIPAACSTAQIKMEILGNSSQRTTDQNLFMFVLGIAKLGTYLKARADTDSDGTVDAGFSSCGNQGPPYVSDSDINEIISGLGLIFDNLASVGASIGGNSAVEDLNAFKETCQSLPGLTNCALTDPNSVAITPFMRLVFRELIRTSDIGIQSACTSADIGTPSGGGTICCP